MGMVARMIGMWGKAAFWAGLMTGGGDTRLGGDVVQGRPDGGDPVTMQGMRAVVDTRINGRPAPFILDSGAFFSNIWPAVAHEFNLPQQPLPNGMRLGGIGGGTGATVATVRHFSLAGLDIPNVQFTVAGSDIGQSGLIGQNVLGLADVEYDLPGGMVRLFKPMGCGRAAMAYWTRVSPFSKFPSRRRRPRTTIRSARSSWTGRS